MLKMVSCCVSQLESPSDGHCAPIAKLLDELDHDNVKNSRHFRRISDDEEDQEILKNTLKSRDSRTSRGATDYEQCELKN